LKSLYYDAWSEKYQINGMVFNQAQEELVPSLLKYGTIKIIKK